MTTAPTNRFVSSYLQLPRGTSGKLTSAALLTLALVTVPRMAQAQDTPAPPPPSGGSGFAPVAALGGGFGGTGQWVFSMETADPGSGSFFIHGSNGNATISLNPAVDAFIASNVSVGGSVTFTHDSSGAGSTSIGIGARAGYNLNITGQIGFWPSLRLFAEHQNVDHNGSSASSFGVFAPFLYHPTPHFFLGAGPDFNLGLSGGSYKEYGIDFIIGGWI
ncbi:MAG TPA: hypothetical protein VFG23_06605 [Polyangia bacterium]|nr:hypothetical protein [Polyangia bacterium]